MQERDGLLQLGCPAHLRERCVCPCVTVCLPSCLPWLQEDSELAAAQANNVQQLLRELQGRLESLKQLSSRLGTLPESLQAVLKAQLEDVRREQC